MTTTAERRAYQAAYYQANKERMRAAKAAAVRRYQLAHPEKKREWNNAYYARNPEQYKEAAKRRRRAKRAARTEPYRDADIFLRDAGICQICLEPVTSDPTIDHIIPLSKGGFDCPANVQLAHRSCNSRKGGR
jgi:5-methylcytosine-specific restriction endonuclease McrA